VLVGGAPATTPSRLVAPGEALTVTGPPPRYVSRGGEKLHAALERFGVDLAGARVLDAGASTGGFSDCALQAGAGAVVAVDVGRGQLHERVRSDPRVVVHDRTNVRLVEPGALGGPVDAVVADLSFISLRTVAAPLLAQARPGADLVLLVKPQFEAGRSEVAAGSGVVTDPEVWSRVLAEVCRTLQGLGAAIMGLMTSPLRGADGNVEFLLHARAPRSPSTPGGPAAPVEAPFDHLVTVAVAEAVAGR
jgi:23S rRNA (cytidine1920-2'-O)/16S rRNA (cytidine1409-2'-O)-methyltransferase